MNARDLYLTIVLSLTTLSILSRNRINYRYDLQNAWQLSLYVYVTEIAADEEWVKRIAIIIASRGGKGEGKRAMRRLAYILRAIMIKFENYQ